MESILKISRNFRGYNHGKLAEKLKIHQSFISYYENGRSIPKESKIIDIGNALEMDPDLLFYSFGLLPPHIKEKAKRFPFYFVEKMKEICESCKDLEKMSEKQLDEYNRVQIVSYMKRDTSNETTS